MPQHDFPYLLFRRGLDWTWHAETGGAVVDVRTGAGDVLDLLARLGGFFSSRCVQRQRLPVPGRKRRQQVRWPPSRGCERFYSVERPQPDRRAEVVIDEPVLLGKFDLEIFLSQKLVLIYSGTLFRFVLEAGFVLFLELGSALFWKLILEP